jgi:hypothetical protein
MNTNTTNLLIARINLKLKICVIRFIRVIRGKRLFQDTYLFRLTNDNLISIFI